MSLIQYYIAEISKHRLLFFDREENWRDYILVWYLTPKQVRNQKTFIFSKLQE